jgi:uncharacterized SAM-binding protein YcdF (DUF218 family)
VTVRAIASRAKRALLWLAAMLLAWWVLCIAAVAIAGRGDSRRRADAIIVLGAAQYDGRPSPVLRARLDHAVELWRAQLAPLVLVTGGVGRGDTTSEAEVGRRYLLTQGIPDSAIILERVGRTSGQSVYAAGVLLRQRGMKSAIMVSDPFHALRLRILAARHGLSAVTSPTRTSPIARNAPREWRYVLSEAAKLPIAAVFPYR